MIAANLISVVIYFAYKFLIHKLIIGMNKAMFEHRHQNFQ